VREGGRVDGGEAGKDVDEGEGGVGMNIVDPVIGWIGIAI